MPYRIITKILPDPGQTFRFIESPKYDYLASGDNNPSYLTFYDEEPVRTRWWYPNIKKGDVIVDIGASFGSYTLPALALGASKIIAFSPQPDSQVFVENLKLNGFRDKVLLYRHGLYSEGGWFNPDKNLFIKDKPPEEEIYGYGTPANIGLFFEVIPLDLPIILDRGSDVKDQKKIDYIKVDVEGAEVEVLKGAKETIKKYKPKLLVENHLIWDAAMKEKVIELVDSFGLGYKHESAPHQSISHTFFWI